MLSSLLLRYRWMCMRVTSPTLTPERAVLIFHYNDITVPITQRLTHKRHKRQSLNDNHFPSLLHAPVRFTSAFCSETLSYYYTVACEYSTYWWLLSLSLHQTAERQWNLHPRGYGGLQEAAKPAKDVRTGLFLFFGLTAEWHWCIWEIQLRSGQRDKKSFWNIPT